MDFPLRADSLLKKPPLQSALGFRWTLHRTVFNPAPVLGRRHGDRHSVEETEAQRGSVTCLTSAWPWQGLDPTTGHRLSLALPNILFPTPTHVSQEDIQSVTKNGNAEPWGHRTAITGSLRLPLPSNIHTKAGTGFQPRQRCANDSQML